MCALDRFLCVQRTAELRYLENSRNCVVRFVQCCLHFSLLLLLFVFSPLTPSHSFLYLVLSWRGFEIARIFPNVCCVFRSYQPLGNANLSDAGPICFKDADAACNRPRKNNFEKGGKPDEHTQRQKDWKPFADVCSWLSKRCSWFDAKSVRLCKA